MALLKPFWCQNNLVKIISYQSWMQLRFIRTSFVFRTNSQQSQQPSTFVEETPIIESINIHPISRAEPIKPYRNLFPWKNEIELAKLLVNNIVYWNYGLIGIVKPYGLHMYDNNAQYSPGTNTRNKYKAEQILNSGIVGSPRYNLTQVLDLIAQLIGVSKLHLVKCKFNYLFV